MSQVNWQKLVTRPQTLLTAEFVLRGLGRELPKLLGTNLNVKFEFENGFGTVFEDIETRANLNKIFEEKARKNQTFLKEHEVDGRKKFSNLIKVSEEIKNSKLNVGKVGLLNHLHKYREAFYKYAPFLHTVFSAEAFLTKKLTNQIAKHLPKKSENDRQTIFQKLTAVEEESDFITEQKSLLKIAIKRKRGLSIKKDLESHAKRFGYMGLSNSFLSVPYPPKHFKNLVNEIRDPEIRLRDLVKTKDRERETYKKIASSLPPDIVKTAEILQKYMLFRNDRITALKIGQHNIKPLLKKIASIGGSKLEDIYWYKLPEIEELILTNKKVNVAKRKRFIAAILVNGSLKYDESVKKIEKKEKLSQLVGYPASKGKVKGKVKLILSIKDIKKMKDGDILVTTMTTPDLVPAMRRAVAILTDEGGILSHAAIVSREFGIPCIVGTRKATSILKDGDMVEIDANQGIVKIL